MRASKANTEAQGADGQLNAPTVGLDLYWLPLGAGGHSVRWNGRVYEAVCALLERRAATELYHSALRLTLARYSWMIEMTPVWMMDARDHGVVAEGAVGTRWAGRSRLFRYEVHCWRDGSIADIADAVASPTRLSSDEAICRRLLSVLPYVPTPVWGRDELDTGEMWNSNSVTSWALAASGLDADTVTPPDGGRAPGWSAGVVAGRRRHEPWPGVASPVATIRPGGRGGPA
jgi:hypothetical protein